jgi:hypothetical protein
MKALTLNDHIQHEDHVLKAGFPHQHVKMHEKAHF